MLVCSNASSSLSSSSSFSDLVGIFSQTHSHLNSYILNLLVSWLRHYAHPFGVYDRHFTRKRHFFTRICIWDRIISNIALHTDTRVHIFHLLKKNMCRSAAHADSHTQDESSIHRFRQTSHFKQSGGKKLRPCRVRVREKKIGLTFDLSDTLLSRDKFVINEFDKLINVNAQCSRIAIANVSKYCYRKGKTSERASEL